MRLPLAALALLSSSALSQTAALKSREPDPTRAAAALPITRVALYKNGVGFFEHSGRVTGDQAVQIDFTSAQLNDVLQSLTAIDLNGGRISGAGYNSTTPLDQQLRTLPLALTDDPSDVDFYNAIRGARVQVNGPGIAITGRLLSIDLRKSAAKDNEPAVDHRFLTVVADSGQVRTIELTPTVSVTLLDPALHTEVTRYLELIANARSQGLRHLTLLDRAPAGGTGSRDLRVSYISEVPVWKSTYRILFTDAKQAGTPTGGATATIQGWSVVDNTTGSDWLNVHLDLIAGAPQSFIQPLSIPYYSRRPEIPIPGQAQLAPQTFDSGEGESNKQTAVQGFVTDGTGAVIPNARVTVTNTANGSLVARNSGPDGRFTVPVGQPGQYRVEIAAIGFNTFQQQNVYVGEQQAANLNARLNVGSSSNAVMVTADANSPVMESASISSLPLKGRAVSRVAKVSRGVVGYGSGTGMGAGAPPPPPPPAPIADYAAAAQASLTPQTSTSSFDDFFEYTLTDPITIRKNESALVPILQTKLPVERVSLWSVAQPVALRALWVTDSSTLTLDRGSFSIVENGNFGGEGLLDPIHPGEKRLLSYAADQAVHVSNASGAQVHRLRSVVIAKGIITEQFRDSTERDYTVRNAAPEARTVLLEHSRTPGYVLEPTNAKKPEETLPNSYRFRVEVPAGATAHLKVAESRAYSSTLQVGGINPDQIRILLQQMGPGAATNEAALRQQLQPVLDAQTKVADLEARKSALDDRLTTLDSEEERQRANILALKDVDKVSQKRFVDGLSKIEDQILELQKQDTALGSQLEAAQADLAAKVNAVQFTQTLEP